MHEFDFNELEDATQGFSPSRFIGKGSHGLVYKGILKNGDIIAVKKQSSSFQKLQDNSKLENESRILSSISNINHPCLIKILGISHDLMRNKLIVMEFMPNGTLDELLHSDSVTAPGWIKRLEIAVEIAKGVEFLHEAEASRRVIVHRDIKSANVLFDCDWNARLCDFGLAVTMEDDGSEKGDGMAGAGGSQNRPAGTIGYLDPCYTVPEKLSTKIDVFSYGVLLLEIISGRKVMDFSKSPTSIVDWASQLIGKHKALDVCDKRVQVPRLMEGMITSMLSIASRCVLSIGENRPSMKQVVLELQNCRRFLEEPVRFPIWMNFLPCSLFLLRGGQRKLNGLKG